MLTGTHLYLISCLLSSFFGSKEQKSKSIKYYKRYDAIRLFECWPMINIPECVSEIFHWFYILSAGLEKRTLLLSTKLLMSWITLDLDNWESLHQCTLGNANTISPWGKGSMCSCACKKPVSLNTSGIHYFVGVITGPLTVKSDLSDIGLVINFTLIEICVYLASLLVWRLIAPRQLPLDVLSQ